MSKVKWVARTAVFLALLICLQFFTRSLGQFVTGSCVNFVLAMAAMTCGIWSGLCVALISPFCAFLLGIGPAFIQMVPCVAAGNGVFVLLMALVTSRFVDKRNHIGLWIGTALSAVAKFLTLYLLLVKWVAPMVVPVPKLATVTAAFTWPQLITALIGGALASYVASLVRKAIQHG